MILYSFIFLIPFVFLLSFAPASLPDGLSGYWAAAAWTLKPVGPATLPLPILLGKASFFLFPFGTPAFRINLMGILLVALTPLLAFRIFSLARPRPLPVPTLLDLDEERAWATITLMTISPWIFSPLFLREGTSGLTPASNLFFPLLALERFFSWRRASRYSKTPGIRGGAMGAAGGLALTLDLRWLLLLPVLIVLRPKKSHPTTALLPFLVGIPLLLSFLAPWVALFTFQTATVTQLIHALPSAIVDGLCSTSHFLEENPSTFLWVGGLYILYGVARWAKVLSARFPRGVPAVFGVILLISWVLIFNHPPHPTFTESETNDLFRSLPPGSTLVCSQGETLGAATYAQMVLGKRRDLHLVGENEPVEGREPRFVELSGKEKGPVLPVGFVLQPLDMPLTNLSSPLAQVSLGRVPMLLAESPLSSPFLGQAHRRLGKTFEQLQIPDQAEEEFLAGLAIDPQDNGTNDDLGRLLMDYGDKKRAVAALARTTRFKSLTLESAGRERFGRRERRGLGQ
jgi:hypothetical protein